MPRSARAARRWYPYGPDVTAWIEATCVLPSGEHIGRPFRLMAWQKDWINELYACDAKGNLRYRWSLLGIPKKNGKSTMIAALALYHLMADPDEADPWAVCAAASDRQADLVFNAAKLMCELSAVLRDATDRYRWEIRPKGRPVGRAREELESAHPGWRQPRGLSGRHVFQGCRGRTRGCGRDHQSGGAREARDFACSEPLHPALIPTSET
jgi:hypothetical protein